MRELLVVAVAIVILVGWFLLSRSEGKPGVAHFSVNGTEVFQVRLADTPDHLIDLRQWGVPGTLEVKEGKIRFIDVTCPDHICEKEGWKWLDGQMAVCMPNRASLVIVEE